MVPSLLMGLAVLLFFGGVSWIAIVGALVVVALWWLTEDDA
jgi:hypothetical protein